MNNNITILILILTLILTLSASLTASDYVVSGAGSDECNGTYIADEEINGKTSYIYDGSTTFYLYYDSYNEYWCIGYDTSYEYDDNYYFISSTDDTPPSTGWEYNYGNSPAPTVVLKTPTLNYSSAVFYESDANDGTISNSLTITYSFNESDSFSGTNGTFSTTNYTASNVPDGLTVVITRTSDTELSVALTGTASSHTNTQDVSTMEIAFNNSAFTEGDASAVTNATKSDIEVDFFQEYYVAASGGDFTALANAVAAADNRDIINVAAGTYTEAGITITSRELTIVGAGAAVTIIQANATANTASNRVFKIDASTIKIKDVTIQNGKTTEGGGAIFCYDSAVLTLENVTFFNNVASSSGGAIHSTSSDITMNNCTFAGNSVSQSGGAIFLNYGAQDISNTTFSGNSASTAGAIYKKGGTVSIINCTIANNTATTCGGYYFNFGTLTMSNTILANNTSSDYYVSSGGTLTDNGYNIVENQAYISVSGTWYFHQPTDILYSHDYLGNTEGASGLGWNLNDASISGDLNLSSTLADNNTTNGTQTLALTSGSFAIDAGTETDAPTTDQRGASRNGSVDIGAYEYWDDDASLPVALTSFTAELTGNVVALAWHTESETENLGFIIQRKTVGANHDLPSEWSQIASYSTDDALASHGSTSEAHEYAYTDAAVVPGETYSYRLADVDYSGTATWYSALEVTVPEGGSFVPTEFGLQKAYPNPFNPAVTLGYALTADARTSLKVYNMLGQEVATLVNAYQNSGNYTCTWQPENLSAGIYLVRLESGKKTNMQKVVFVK